MAASSGPLVADLVAPRSCGATSTSEHGAFLISASATLPNDKASPGRRTPDSKQDQIVALLRQPGGATLDVLVKATGWQKHSVRGFLAGTVRKKLKLPLLSEKIDGVRTYRIGGSRVAKSNKKRRPA